MLKVMFCLLFFCSSMIYGQAVVINEIYFEPLDKTLHEEFIELYNSGDAMLDLSGWFFSKGISFKFPQGSSIGPGKYLVIAEDPAVVENNFGNGFNLLGPYDGSLSNDGECITLRDQDGNVIDTVDYKYGFPWPTATTGEGSSLELINPSLDNNLGGSWRASGLSSSGNPTRQYFLESQDPTWHYRKGTSNPDTDWRSLDYQEDGSWKTGQTSIGYGDDDDNTVLSDMGNNYSSIYLRHKFTIESEQDISGHVVLGVYVDDGAIVWINGQEVARLHVSAGDKNYDDVGISHEAAWEEVEIPNISSVVNVGENIICVHALNTSKSSSDFSIDVSLYIPADNEVSQGRPTPGAVNSVFSDNSPPIVRHVKPVLDTPSENESNLVTAKITDSDGIESVDLFYQVVLPGHYIPASLPLTISQLLSDPDQPRAENPDFANPENWTKIKMVDDGTGGDETANDNVFSAAIPGQENRTLVRYRISAADKSGHSVLVPYADDPSLNFAYFVYNGVPDYHADTSILGRPVYYESEALTSVPVYILITRNKDFMEAMAPNSSQQIPQGTEARFSFNWEGAIYHDGVLYDHVTYRLRGGNGRYQVPPGNPGNVPGKRLWRFHFRKGHHLQTCDNFGKPYKKKWKMLNIGRMFGNRLDGNWGLSEFVNFKIWNAYDVPSPQAHVFHWRVVDGEEEVPPGVNGQYLGDFWGIARAFENYDAQFLENHDLEKGNLYKLVNQTQKGLDQLRYQAPDAVSDGSDHDNIANNLRSSRSADWLNSYVNYDEWYRYHAICQAVRNYDFWPSADKNAAWYFEPDYTPQNNFLGRMWTLPWDTDGTWGPTWNAGIDLPYDAIFSGGGKPDFQKEYRNHIREVRDLLWQHDQLEQVIRQNAAFIFPLQNADIDRWRNAPAEAGRQYFSASNQKDLEGKIADMLKFAFVGGSWPGGNVGTGGRAAFLDSLADGPYRNDLPGKPEVTYTGAAGFPVDGLTFMTSDFSDPQGANTFKAMKWRIAKVSDIPDPGSKLLNDPIWKTEPVHLEIKAAWESEDIAQFDPEITIPLRYVEVGQMYRVRVRMLDATDLWSHWSDPVEFTAGQPAADIPELDSLRITEIMYNPLGDSDYEFIELQNRGSQTLDLSNVWFSNGIKFSFSESTVKTLAPGEIVVLVKDLAVFSTRYDTSSMKIAGEYSLKQNNSGEEITLTYGGNITILDFTYDPSWYPETDGLGFSLNILDINSAPENWNNPANWFSSTELYGSPGRIDTDASGRGLLRPGDVNTDGSIDLSDAVKFLLILFSPGDIPLPCDGASVTDGGNLVMLDFNGDDEVNIGDVISMLQYLFAEGPPNKQGQYCKRIEGCPNACYTKQ